MSIKAMKQVIELYDKHCYNNDYGGIEFNKNHGYKFIEAIEALRTAIQQATQPAEVTDDQIESCALEAGFSVESTGSIWAVDGYVGTRVDPGLRKFARAILAPRPVQVPMTDEAKQKGASYWAPEYRGAFAAGIAWCEQQYGITAQAKKGGDK